MERTHVDTYTENLISNVEGVKLVASRFGIFYVSFQHLTGYIFLNATIISGTNIKTGKGCELVFSTRGKVMRIISDSQEVESDYSNISNRWLTKISFVVTQVEKDMIRREDFDSLYLNYKNKSLPLKE
jgi:hypothetical protein